MAYFAVLRERGDAWDPSRPMEAQDRWSEHAAFMNALVAQGFVRVGGPLGDGGTILLIVDSPGREEVQRRFDADVWTSMQLLRVVKIEPWQVLLGDMT